MIYLFYGEEIFLIKNRIKSLLKELACDAADVITYDGSSKDFDIQRVLEELNTVSFFTAHKVVLVEQAVFFAGSQSLSEADQTALKKYLNKPFEGSTLIFSLSQANLDKRKNLTKEVLKLSINEQFNPLNPSQMRAQIIRDLSNHQIKLAAGALERLIEKIPCDLMVWQQELAKLALYPHQLTVDVINALVTTDTYDDIFDLTTAVIKNDQTSIFKIYQDLLHLNYDEIAILLILASQLRFLYQVLVYAELGWSQPAIAQKLQAHPFRVSQNLKYQHHLATKTILSYLAKLAQLDQEIKAGNLDKEVALSLFFSQPTWNFPK